MCDIHKSIANPQLNIYHINTEIMDMSREMLERTFCINVALVHDIFHGSEAATHENDFQRNCRSRYRNWREPWEISKEKLLYIMYQYFLQYFHEPWNYDIKSIQLYFWIQKSRNHSVLHRIMNLISTTILFIQDC